MESNIFEDIEQDNNPSFYGPLSFLTDPYGKNLNPSHGADVSNANETSGEFPTALVNNSIGLSNQIGKFLNDPKLSIDIINSERLMNSSIIVYTIELSLGSNNPIIVKRRYSEFKSLRDNLLRLFPTLIIPPIPEKHSLFNYLINSIDNSKELNIIEMRKRSFKTFLVDLIFNSNHHLKECQLLHKFLDPNYELCWINAINEPPVSLLPNNLLLANPINPTDQNGLYSLLPIVNGFEFNSQIDNLSSLKKINADLHRLNEQAKLFKLKDEEDYNNKFKNSINSVPLDQEFFEDIPQELINFEVNFHQNIKVLSDLNKLNNKSIKNFKAVVNILIELGGNLNNFSLQIHELSDNQDSNSNQLSQIIEKFGSTMDVNFLNFESFVMLNLIPNWQEPINQLIQYYLSSLQIIKFYKYKLVQFKLLSKLKFNKIQELMNFNQNFDKNLKLNDLKNLKIDSPSINNAIKRIELKQKKLQTSGRSLNSKKSWYGLFGGNKQSFVLPDDTQFNHYLNQNGTPTSAPQKPESYDINSQINYKISQIEKELVKLDQLINLVNNDMTDLTDNLRDNFGEFLVNIERKWLKIMLEFLKSGKQLFTENLGNWTDLKLFIDPEKGTSELSSEPSMASVTTGPSTVPSTEPFVTDILDK